MAKNDIAGVCRNTLSARFLGVSALLFVVPVVQACAVAPPAKMVSSTADPIKKAGIALHSSDEDSPHRKMFGAALRQSFQKHSVTIGAAAETIADYAFSVRQSDLGLVDAEALTAGQQETIWVSPPRKSRRLDKCEPVRLRATLVMFRVSDGKIAYRGAAESDRCSVTEAVANELADTLVGDAMAKSEI